MRPLLLRPPVFLMVVTISDFSGVDVVMSSNDVASLCLVPAVIGFNFFSAIACQLYVAIKINYFTFCQRNDRLLVAWLAARQHSGFCITGLLLSHYNHRIHLLNVHAVLFFNGFLNLNFVGVRVHDKSVLALFVQGGNLLSHQWLSQDAHHALFNKFSTLLIELSTKITRSAFITSY